jgi:hypothetical protein
MGDTPSDSGKRPIAPSAPPATPAPPRSASHRTQERRRALIISCGMLLVAALTAGVVIAIESPMSVHSSNSPQVATAPDGDLRTAKITKDLDGKGCWQQIFDNQTGRMTKSQQACEATTYDSNGAPVPIGTIHRLDAISKSFSSH